MFRPRMIICAAIFSSTNKWDFEPGLLSLVINHVYLVARWQSMLLFLFFLGGDTYDEAHLPHLLRA